MRIAFCGASGTGKSTLAKWIVENAAELKLDGIELNPVGSRSVAKAMGFSSPYDVDKAYGPTYDDFITQKNLRPEAAAFAALVAWEARPQGPTVRPRFQLKLQADKIAWEADRADAGSFVTDRTPLDDLAYAVLHCREIVDAAFYERAMEHTKSYDVVFYCPLPAGQWLDNDSARVVDKTYHVLFDALLWGLLDTSWDLRARSVYLSLPGREAREALIRDGIDEAGRTTT